MYILCLPLTQVQRPLKNLEFPAWQGVQIYKRRFCRLHPLNNFEFQVKQESTFNKIKVFTFILKLAGLKDLENVTHRFNPKSCPPKVTPESHPKMLPQKAPPKVTTIVVADKKELTKFIKTHKFIFHFNSFVNISVQLHDKKI